jgi:hypothetical protein
VARWETQELAQAALLEYAATTRRPAEQYGVQTQVEAVEYANQRRRDYHRKRPYEVADCADKPKPIRETGF